VHCNDQLCSITTHSNSCHVHSTQRSILDVVDTRMTKAARHISDLGTRLYEVVVKIENCPGDYSRTKQVLLLPRYVIANRTSMQLRYRQLPKTSYGADDPGFGLQDGQNIPFHWPDVNGNRKIQVQSLFFVRERDREVHT